MDKLDELKKIFENTRVFHSQYEKYFKNEKSDIEKKAEKIFSEELKKEVSIKTKKCKKIKKLKKALQKTHKLMREAHEKIENMILCFDCSKEHQTYWICSIKFYYDKPDSDPGQYINGIYMGGYPSGIIAIPIFYTKNPLGNIYYSFPEEGQIVGMYSHFFDRLVQREYKDDSDRAIAISRFFSSQKNLDRLFLKFDKDNNKVTATFNDGLLLGKWVVGKYAEIEKIQMFIYFITFVDKDKLYPNQQKIVEELKKLKEAEAKTDLLS